MAFQPRRRRTISALASAVAVIALLAPDLVDGLALKQASARCWWGSNGCLAVLDDVSPHNELVLGVAPQRAQVNVCLSWTTPDEAEAGAGTCAPGAPHDARVPARPFRGSRTLLGSNVPAPCAQKHGAAGNVGSFAGNARMRCTQGRRPAVPQRTSRLPWTCACRRPLGQAHSAKPGAAESSPSAR